MVVMATYEIGNVPCDGCTACCKNQVVLVTREDAIYDDPRLCGPFADTGVKAVPLVGEDKRCLFLGALGCTIYDHRPAMCRDFDCRDLVRYLEGTTRHRRRKLATESEVLAAGVARYHTLPANIRNTPARGTTLDRMFARLRRPPGAI